MLKKQRAYNAEQEAALARKPNRKDYWDSHPGTLESLVPVWGSTREAIADYREGDVVGALVNAGLAVSDLAPGAYAIKTGGKGLAKVAGSHTWNATRKWMGKNGLLEAGQHGHHGIIPRGGWGKNVANSIKNQPWNITAMPSGRVVHGRIHGPYQGQPQYGQVERYWRGAPDWAKRAHVWLPSGAATAVDAQQERR